MTNSHTAGIAGTGSYLPEKILSNADLEKIVETSDEWIFTRTGMRERRVAAADQATSDLCVEAAKRALESAEMTPDQLQMIIVATVTPDMPTPSTSSLISNKLGAYNAGGWDINNACTGFMSALMAARGMIEAGLVDNALIFGAECLSRIVNYADRSSCILFGDGAGAMILKADHERGTILDTTSGMDGRQWEAIHQPGGGSLVPASHESVEAGQHFLSINGNEVFKFAVSKFRSLIAETLERTGYTAADIGRVVPHQVNIRIIESALKKLEIDMDRVEVNLDRYGNTSAASIPIAFDEALRAGRIEEGALISFVAFGAGLSWGASLLRW